MTEMATMTREVRDDLPVLLLEGEVDASNAPALAAELRSMLTNAVFAIVVDISQATYFDSAGLNALAVLDKELATRQQHLHVVAPPGSRARRILEVTRMDTVLALHDELPDAVEAARAHG